MTADQQVLSVTPSQTRTLTVSKPWGAVRAAVTQGAWTSMARSLIVPVPRLMQGVEQWLPDDSIISIGQSVSSAASGPSPSAAVGSRHSIAGPAGMAADGKAVQNMPGSSLTSTSGPSPSAAVGNRYSIAGPAGMAADGKAVHKMPGSSLTSSSSLPSQADTEQAAGAAALPLLQSSSYAVKTTAAAASTSLEMPEDNAEVDRRASDVGYLLSSLAGRITRPAGHSPAAKLPPRKG